MITYTNSLKNLSADQLAGFFVDWPNPPSRETHLRLLRSSTAAWLAVEEETRQVVGFITAISDGVLSAYIPFLEVLPEFQHQGIGQELVRRMLETLKGFYMVDLLCDAELQGFYAPLGMHKADGMMIRNYDKQTGQE